MYNKEVEGNILLAAFVETFLMIWVVEAAGRYLIAPFQKTQEGIDHYCRMYQLQHLPFSTSDAMRVIAAGTLWSGLFPVVTMWLCIYYPVSLFVVRTNLLGRFEPGPPTKPLQYRFVFTIYLPLHLLLHLVLTFGIYADVQVPDPENLGSGLWPGFQSANAFSSGPKAFHSVCCLLVLVAVLVVIPYMERVRALRQGVHTPLQICRTFFIDLLGDVDFGSSARTSVGIHHLTSPAFFGCETPADHTAPVIDLPAVLPKGATYEPVCGIDLLAQ